MPRDGTSRHRTTRLPGSGREVVTIGVRTSPLRDAYHSLLTARWAQFFVLVLFAYLGANLLFASGYLAIGDGIEEARPGNFSDAFFFSVQTMATIGYGKMAPRGLAANLLVTLEALIGLLGLALVTGLVFAKFSRPTARVLFSRNMVITRFDGVPSLLLRIANERGNQIAEAQAHLVLMRTERTAEGEVVRRVHDLHLRRSQSAFFAFTWLLVHPITPGSPLHGETPESLREKDVDLVASMTGLDETLSQSVHARHAWTPDQILWNHHFADVVATLPDGRRAIDYRKFHDVVADGSPAGG
ncbi:MAG: ion channel [Deltaproteobacteria bacterium]|nr:ion channel [Deltaproteobacteria bacterium]